MDKITTRRAIIVTYQEESGVDLSLDEIMRQLELGHFSVNVNEYGEFVILIEKFK